MWEHEDRLYLRVKVDSEGILGKIAMIRAKEEELREIVNDLKDMLETEEEN